MAVIIQVRAYRQVLNNKFRLNNLNKDAVIDQLRARESSTYNYLLCLPEPRI